MGTPAACNSRARCRCSAIGFHGFLVRRGAQQGLEFCKDLLDWVQVRAIGRQEQQARTARLNGFAYASDPMAPEIIDYHDVPRPQRGCAASLDGTNGKGICRIAVYQGRYDPGQMILEGDTASTVIGLIYAPDASLTLNGNGGFSAGNYSVGTLSNTPPLRLSRWCRPLH
jgi:hypothetical protein